MTGIPLSDICFVYGAKKSVLYNTTLPESTLKKKINPIAYHAVIEEGATGKWLTGYEPTDTNVSDLLPILYLVERGVLVSSREVCIIFDWIGCGFSILESFPHERKD